MYSAFLKTLSLAYGMIVSVRNCLFDSGLVASYRSKIPVISIGNVTIGGSGKTPLAIAVVEELQMLEHKPVVLSRGYGGNIVGPHVVSVDSDTATNVGDEPYLIANRTGVTVVIARSRVAGARFIENNKLGDVIVLDDALQHRYLSRTLNIISIDSSSSNPVEALFSNRLIPYGILREPLTPALKRADAIVLSRRVLEKSEDSIQSTAIIDQTTDKLQNVVERKLPFFTATIQISGIQHIHKNNTISPQRVIAFCGIANPEIFHSSLETLGFSLMGIKSFTDHHSFSDADIHQLLQRYPGVPLVCTEKDAVKLGNFKGADIYQLKMKTVVEPRDLFVETLKKCFSKVS